jgi:hypothetical protein
LNEPGITLKHPDFDKYTKIIEYKNIEIAVLQMYQKKEGVFMNEFEIFSPFLKEEFLKNKEKILASLQEKAVEFPNIDSIVTMLYSMNVVLNFPKLLDNFQKAIMVKPIINENE